MPYCHNALIFRKNKLKYNSNLKISSDYEYLLLYLINLGNSNLFSIKRKSICLVPDLLCIFENEKGVSSNKKYILHKENLIILLKNFNPIFSILYIIIRLSILIKRLIIKNLCQ